MFFPLGLGPTDGRPAAGGAGLVSLVCAPDFPSSFSSEFLGSEEVAAGRDEERAG